LAAILSIIETCRRVQIPVREYLAAVLPGLADVRIQRLAETHSHGLGRTEPITRRLVPINPAVGLTLTNNSDDPLLAGGLSEACPIADAPAKLVSLAPGKSTTGHDA